MLKYIEKQEKNIEGYDIEVDPDKIFCIGEGGTMQGHSREIYVCNTYVDGELYVVYVVVTVCPDNTVHIYVEYILEVFSGFKLKPLKNNNILHAIEKYFYK